MCKYFINIPSSLFFYYFLRKYSNFTKTKTHIRYFADTHYIKQILSER